MSKTLPQIDRAYCAMEKRRDAIRKASNDKSWSPSVRFALARASDELTKALAEMQQEVRR